jgi:hypothetical protein
VTVGKANDAAYSMTIRIGVGATKSAAVGQAVYAANRKPLRAAVGITINATNSW